MTPHLTNRTVLQALAEMPFVDSSELAAAAGMPPRTVRYVLRRMCDERLVEAVSHSRCNSSRTTRWIITPAGIEKLAQMHRQGQTEALRLYPISAQWRQNLLGRLDAVACLYRVFMEIAAIEGKPGRWRWYRETALDAVVQLSDGRTAGLMHIGSTRSGNDLVYRLDSVSGWRARGQLYALLAVVPGEFEARRVLAHMTGKGVHVAVAKEADLMSAFPRERVWRYGRDGAPIALGEVMRCIPQANLPQLRVRSRRVSMPGPVLSDDAGEKETAAAQLSMPARRILRLLFDWPLVRTGQLHRMMGVSEGHARRGVGLLSRLGLVHHLRIGRTPPQRRRNEPRICLSARGLRHLAGIDRTNSNILLKHWLMEPDRDGDDQFHIPNFSVEGTKARVLLRERLHTNAIYAFVTLLQESCNGSSDRQLEQILPPHRCERKFKPSRRHGYRYRKRDPEIKPDGVFLLRQRDKLSLYFVEVERRAIVPSRMRPKLSLYRVYFDSPDTTDDFLGLCPTVLMIYDRVEDASRFAAFASRDGGEKVRMLVSSMQQIETAGSFGQVWLDPWNLDRGYCALG